MVLGIDWLRDRVSMLGARITKHPRFDKAVTEAFELNDVTNDNSLNPKELEVSLHLFILRLNSYMPVSLPVPTTEEVKELMEKYDVNENGSIEMDEFRNLCAGMMGSAKYSVPKALIKAAGVQLLLLPFVAGQAKKVLGPLRDVSDVLLVPAVSTGLVALGVRI